MATGSTRAGRSSLAITVTGAAVSLVLLAVDAMLDPAGLTPLRWAFGVAVIAGVAGLALGLVAGPRAAGRSGTLAAAALLALAAVFGVYSLPSAPRTDEPAAQAADAPG